MKNLRLQQEITKLRRAITNEEWEFAAEVARRVWENLVAKYADINMSTPSPVGVDGRVSVYQENLVRIKEKWVRDRATGAQMNQRNQESKIEAPGGPDGSGRRNADVETAPEAVA